MDPADKIVPRVLTLANASTIGGSKTWTKLFVRLIKKKGSEQESGRMCIIRGFLKNKDFRLQHRPTTTFCTKWAELLGSLWK
jgi:hypothetical protein